MKVAKPRTPEQLSDALDEELGWRRKELLLLKGEVRLAQGLKKDMVLRAGCALLYAHWEGFVKAATQRYVDYVALRRMTYDQLCTPLAALALKKYATRLADRGPPKVFRDLLEQVRDKGGERAHIARDGVINTEANLSTTVFERILEDVGLDPEPFSLSRKLFDEGLLSSRNQVAHGRNQKVDADTFLAWYEHVDNAMGTLVSAINNAALHRAYSR